MQRKIRHHHRPSHKCQQGVVIVVALFIVALAAAMAYLMMARVARDTQRASLILRNTQAEYYVQGSVKWAMDELRNNWEKQKPNQVIDILPMKPPANNENGYTISTTIYDMQARFNLNNLINPEVQGDFIRLLRVVDPTLNDEKAKEITRAVSDWIMPGTQQNEFSKYYSELPLPYRPAHRPMQSISELHLVKGMTATLFNALQDYVTALPVTTLINVQSASAPVLMTLSPSVQLETGKMIEQARLETPFVTTQQFLNLDIVKNHPVPAEKITVTSGYFLVETDVSIEKQQVVIYTLLERTGKQGKAEMTILWQSKGTL